MKKLMVAMVVGLMAVAMFAGVALAAGPSAGKGPWTAVGFPCFTNSGAQGHLMLNTNNGKTHCFKN